jgi:hypothetical protein
MELMKTTALAFIRTASIWLAFAAITLIYLFGVSAMKVVEFVSHESFGSVCGRVFDKGVGEVDFSYHGWILAGAFAVLLVHTFSKERVRVAIAALCVITPWFWTGLGIKGTAGWLLVMPATPLWTLQIVGSGADGEFYAEGFVVGVAVGWWMILWSITGYTDYLKLRRELKNAVPELPERRFERQSHAFRQGPGALP